MKTKYIAPASAEINLCAEDMLALSPTPGATTDPGQYGDPDDFEVREFNGHFGGGTWDDSE